MGRMDPRGWGGSLQAGWVHVAELSPSKDGSPWSGCVPQQGWVLLGCEGTPAGVRALVMLLGSVGDKTGLEWGPSASRRCCAGKFWGLCLRELLGIGGAVLVVTGICARGPEGSGIQGGTPGAALGAVSGVCVGLLWGCAGAGAGWEPQRGGDSGVAWGQGCFGTAPLSAACSRGSVLAPILPRRGSLSLQPPRPCSPPSPAQAGGCGVVLGSVPQ